jgi:hypothetical protein
MSSQEKAAGWLHNLDRLVRVRNEIAALLEDIAQNLTQAESQAENTSGKLGLSKEIERLIQHSEKFAPRSLSVFSIRGYEAGKKYISQCFARAEFTSQ